MSEVCRDWPKICLGQRARVEVPTAGKPITTSELVIAACWTLKRSTHSGDPSKPTNPSSRRVASHEIMWETRNLSASVPPYM